MDGVCVYMRLHRLGWAVWQETQRHDRQQTVELHATRTNIQCRAAHPYSLPPQYEIDTGREKRTRHARRFDLLRSEHPEALHLMEDWIVCSVHRVSAVHIPCHEKALLPFAQQLRLMSGCVTPVRTLLVRMLRFGASLSNLKGTLLYTRTGSDRGNPQSTIMYCTQNLKGRCWLKPLKHCAARVFHALDVPNVSGVIFRVRNERFASKIRPGEARTSAHCLLPRSTCHWGSVKRGLVGPEHYQSSLQCSLSDTSCQTC